jgi:hypothetical protein
MRRSAPSTSGGARISLPRPTCSPQNSRQLSVSQPRTTYRAALSAVSRTGYAPCVFQTLYPPVAAAPRAQSSDWCYWPSTVPTDLDDSASRHTIRGTWPSCERKIDASPHPTDDRHPTQTGLSGRTPRGSTQSKRMTWNFRTCEKRNISYCCDNTTTALDGERIVE